MKSILIWILAAALVLSGCGGESGIEIHDAWLRPAAAGGNGAIYFELHNHSSTADELVGASSDVAEVVEIHESMMEGDVMQMHMLPSLPLEPDADVSFEPGGLHVMLIGMKQDVQAGDHVEFTLHFQNHADITLTAEVGEGAAEHGDSH